MKDIIKKLRESFSFFHEENRNPLSVNLPSGDLSMLDGIDINKPVALFDVDGVLVKPYVIRHFPEYLVSQYPVAFIKSVLMRMDDALAKYKSKAFTYEEFANEWVALYAQGVAGQTVDQINVLAESFWDESEVKLLYPYSRELVNTLKPYCTIIAISGSTKDGLLPLVRRLGIDYLFATEVKIEDGHYSPHNPVNRAINKGKQRVIEDIRIRVDESIWEKSFAFGDNAIHDFPLLEYVRSPYLFGDTSSAEKQVQKEQEYEDLKAKLTDVRFIRQPQDNDEVVAEIQRRLSKLDII